MAGNGCPGIIVISPGQIIVGASPTTVIVKLVEILPDELVALTV